MDSDLGAKVKKLRIAHGLTQEDVAKALEVTPGYISNVENGRNLMTLRMLSYYAELTGVSLDYLLGRTTDHEIKKEAPPAMAEGEAEVSFSFPTGDEAAFDAGFDSEGHAFESHRAYQTKEPPKGGFFVDLQGFFSF